jgi:DNA-binding NtrC family response regulator
VAGVTITASDPDSRDKAAARPRAYIALAMHYESPLSPTQRYALEDVHDVIIGRAEQAGSSRKIAEGRVAIRVDVADPRMSGEHARISREAKAWTLTDLGSRNGAFVNGARVDRRYLEDGDHIELGRTMFVFRVTSADAPEVGGDELAGQPTAMRTLHAPLSADMSLLARAAVSRVAVMVNGETGTGKELVARAVHELSGRSGDFIAVNCGAIAKTLLEAELFGYKKGAFSGASEDRAGLVRAADGGTLFLDEVAELPEQTQVALLRVLQESEVLPVGATKAVRVDLRVVTATHRNLEALVSEGGFREDLYARLCGRDLVLPPLRERSEDLGLLIAAFVRDIAGDRADAITFRRSAARALFAYDWPRNIRELRTAIEATISVLEGDQIDLDLLPRAVREAFDRVYGETAEPSRDRRDAEVEVTIRDLLREHNGNVTAAAKAMGKSRGHFHRLMQKFGIEAADFRA